MKNIDLTNVQEAEDFERLAPGGYICVIKTVEDVPDREYLRIEFDIAAGDHAGFYQRTYESSGYWLGSTIRSYKDSALRFFKSFITAIENSNPGYHWNNDESTLVGKKIGLVLSEEEYRSKKGEVKMKLVANGCHSIQKITSGEYKVPALKKLKDDDLYNKPAEIGNIGSSIQNDLAPSSN